MLRFELVLQLGNEMELSSGVPNWTRGMPDQSAAKKEIRPQKETRTHFEAN